MDQIEVHIRQAQLFQAFVHRLVRVVVAVPVSPELGGHEQVLARHAGRAQPGAHARLVAIDGRGVHRAVTGRQRLLHAGGGLLVRHLPDAQPQLRDLVAVVQFHCGYFRHKTLRSLHRDTRAANTRQVAQSWAQPGLPQD
ncbi:hypothetical protein G6F22_018821 [Rhizopus arrhizus]|nr:hypothetical protein G6F22_018821 [Rhizopus arrhizus]